MQAGLRFVTEVAGEVIYVILILGCVLGLAVGVMLLVGSARVFGWNERMNRWISTRQAMRPLEEPRDVKRFLYRRHRVFGILVFAGALYTLDVLVFGYRTGPLVRAFRGLADQGILEIVFDSVRWFLVAGNLAALLAGVILCFRPSLLKGLEVWADRRYSARKPTKPLEEMHYDADRFVQAHPKLVGSLVLLGSVYVLVNLGLLRLV